MASSSISSPAAIVGIGHTKYSRGSGRSEWELANEAIAKALADAEIDPRDVDGIVRSSYDSVDEAMVLRTFPMQLNYYSQVNYGGMGLPAVIAHASAAIQSGQARIVICYRSLNGYSNTRFGRAERHLGDGPMTIARGDRAPSGAFAGPYGLLAPGQVMAIWLRRYQAMNRVSDEDMTRALGSIAVQQRAYAQNNPDAIMHGRPLDFATYANGRVIYEPLRLCDFALESDGAAAVVVAAPDVARKTPHPPAWVRASIQGLSRYAESISIYRELRNSASDRSAAQLLYERAGIVPTDISTAMLYDATTVTVLLALETYGFHQEGASWRALIDDGIGPDSRLPVNTSGGHLSEAYVHSINLIIEGVRQCRGTSLNQVPDVRNVLCCSGPTAIILAA